MKASKMIDLAEHPPIQRVHLASQRAVLTTSGYKAGANGEVLHRLRHISNDGDGKADGGGGAYPPLGIKHPPVRIDFPQRLLHTKTQGPPLGLQGLQKIH